jgi:hypothetical protein
MKFVEASEKVEVLDQSSVDKAMQARADKRMKRICATPEEVNLYHFAPNRARNGVDHPGMPMEDYGEIDIGGGAKD